MADAIRLLQAAIQAVEAGAPDLAIDFAQRAVQELGGATRPSILPWSTDPKDGDRFEEFNRRAIAFLTSFVTAPSGQLADDRARALAREVFPEQPRMVGPTFYRSRILETAEESDGQVVRVTDKGRMYLKKLQQWESAFEQFG